MPTVWADLSLSSLLLTPSRAAPSLRCTPRALRAALIILVVACNARWLPGLLQQLEFVDFLRGVAVWEGAGHTHTHTRTPSLILFSKPKTKRNATLLSLLASLPLPQSTFCLAYSRRRSVTVTTNGVKILFTATTARLAHTQWLCTRE